MSAVAAKRRWVVVVLAIGVLLFTSLMVTILVSVAIWPGEATLTAPILCDDARPDAYIVSDTYSYRPGEQTTTFTMYCVGPRGDFDEVGVMAPTLILWAAHTVIIVVWVVLSVAIFRLLRRRRAVNEPAAVAIT